MGSPCTIRILHVKDLSDSNPSPKRSVERSSSSSVMLTWQFEFKSRNESCETIPPTLTNLPTENICEIYHSEWTKKGINDMYNFRKEKQKHHGGQNKLERHTSKTPSEASVQARKPQKTWTQMTVQHNPIRQWKFPSINRKQGDSAKASNDIKTAWQNDPARASTSNKALPGVEKKLIFSSRNIQPGFEERNASGVCCKFSTPNKRQIYQSRLKRDMVAAYNLTTWWHRASYLHCFRAIGSISGSSWFRKNCFCSIALTASASLTLFALNYVDGTESSAKYARTLPSYCPRTFTKCLHLETSMLTTIKYRKYMQIWWHVHVKQGNESCDLWGVHFSEAPQRLGPSIVSQSVESSRGATGQRFPRRRVLIAGPAATMLFTTTHQKQPSEWFINAREAAVACVTRITSFIFIQSSDHARVELCPVDPLHPSLIVSPLSRHRTEYFSSFIPGTFCRVPWTLVRESSHIIRRQHYHWHFGRLFDAPNSLKHSMVKAYHGLNGITRPHGIDVTRLFGSPQIRRLSADRRTDGPTYKLHCIEHPTKDTGKDASWTRKEQRCKNKADSKGVWKHQESFSSQFWAWGFQSGKSRWASRRNHDSGSCVASGFWCLLRPLEQLNKAPPGTSTNLVWCLTRTNKDSIWNMAE